MPRQIASINKRIIELLDLSFTEGTPILIGDSNIYHMKNRHPKDYEKYGKHIKSILEKPDYVRKNKKDDSLEYVKEFKVENEYVKVAVRVTSKDKLFIRSLYVLNNTRVQNYIKKGALIKY